MLGLAPDALARRPLRDGLAGALGHREGPDEDELQERRQARRARGRDSDALYRWVAILTGSKNALKGVGFFLGGLLLTVVGFQTAHAAARRAGRRRARRRLVPLMHGEPRHAPTRKAKFRHMFSNNRAVNVLAAARIFLFASRDVWFVVGLPVYLRTVLGWSFWQVGTFLAVWVIGYGIVQAVGAAAGARRAARHGAATGAPRRALAFVLAAFPAGDRDRARRRRRPDGRSSSSG